VKVPQHRNAAALAAARAAAPLTFRFAELPVLAQRDAILAALKQSQVLIVAGDTGSGKSTQLAQYCLESGRGIEGMIAHTQPRRIAARALAARIAQELNQPVGRSVGFKVRFADQVSDATRLLLMTDGLLLAELASDHSLSRYDTIIIDEAHERSLNVDLLLGALKRLLPRRPDLKLIVTSATLDVERIAEFFGRAPVVRVGGRGHPIEVRYAGGAAQDDPDLPPAVLHAYEQIAAEPGDIGRGDVLVFLPGEREIRDVEEFLQRELPENVEVLPLYSRLSWEQQQRIFQPGSRQRIVLSTNVAETSVTVPGIRSVIDSGLARISRYSSRSRLQRLPIEPISAASAEQRKGRCGRLGPGLCIRLYTEEEFAARPPFTEPEILRTNLSALLLRLAAGALGDAASFPFIDPPDSRALNDGYRLLQELQAIDAERRITALGTAMARLPLDPRLARALLESKRFRAESELLAIVSGLSVADVSSGEPRSGGPRGGGPAPAPAADESAALLDGRSEFLGLVKLWRAYRGAREGSRRALRAWCKERRLSLLRLSEWEDVHTQVAERARELGIAARGWTGSYTGVHRALLAGFCTMVGARGEEGAYLGTRGVHFHLFPGSPLARRKPRWVMAANIVETSRVFARRVAQIEPTWIESAAAHLLKREYLSPDWDETREEVVARERVSFLGLVLSANRIVNFGRIAPEESRRIFAREALVYRRLARRPHWLERNDAALLAAQRIEERLRTRGLVHNPEVLVAFYDRVLPRQVSSAATLEYFSRHLTPQQHEALTLGQDDIYARLPDPAALQDFPETASIGGLSIDVHYRFAPGELGDGATLLLPLLALPQFHAAHVQSAVPGFLAPRIEAMLRSLPKEARRSLIPIPAAAREFLAVRPDELRFDARRLEEWLKSQRGIPEALLHFQAGAVPDHLIPRLAVNVGAGEFEYAADLNELRRRCAVAARKELQGLARDLYGGAAWRRFELDELPPSVQVPLAQCPLTLYPTLSVHEQALLVQLEWSADEADSHWFDSAARLACLMLPNQVRELSKKLSAAYALQLSAAPYMSSGELLDTLLRLTVRKACFADAAAPRIRQQYEAAVNDGRERLHEAFADAMAQVSAWLSEAGEVRRALEDPRLGAQSEAASESREHLRSLLNAAAVQGAAPQWTRQLPRYLKAELRRWQRNAIRGPESPRILLQIQHFTERHRQLQQQLQAQLRSTQRLQDLHFWTEELRVSLYAQELKTLGPISAERLEQRAAEIDAWLTR
jgi:ATP-dependent helicase HrpA